MIFETCFSNDNLISSMKVFMLVSSLSVLAKSSCLSYMYSEIEIYRVAFRMIRWKFVIALITFLQNKLFWSFLCSAKLIVQKEVFPTLKETTLKGRFHLRCAALHYVALNSAV